MGFQHNKNRRKKPVMSDMELEAIARQVLTSLFGPMLSIIMPPSAARPADQLFDEVFHGKQTK